MPIRIRGDYLSKFSLLLTFIRLGNTNLIGGYVLKGANYTPQGTPEMTFDNDGIRNFMQSIWNSYSKKNAWELVSITHAKGSP
jgi:hypothetical protein